MIINKNELFHFAKNDEKSTVLGQDDVIAQRTKCRMQYEFPGPVWLRRHRVILYYRPAPGSSQISLLW